jgi:hypothetical protein
LPMRVGDLRLVRLVTGRNFPNERFGIDSDILSFGIDFDGHRDRITYLCI